MIKRTIVISRKSYISHKDEQLLIKQEEDDPIVPIEDIGVVILEDHQSTVTVSALNALMENNCVIIGCDAKHLPNSIMYPISSNTLHTAVLKTQMEASAPLRKHLWQQTIKAKLINQAAILRARGGNARPLELWAKKVRSGDQGNLEGRGAAYYWKNFFKGITLQAFSESSGKSDSLSERLKGFDDLTRQSFKGFIRDPEGDGPNSALNYGYAIVRAAMARAIVGSGLHPSIGLHHKNQYNAFCLADDLMEPYRPFVDLIVLQLCDEQGEQIEMTTENKKRLLAILAMDTMVEEDRKPLMLSLTATTASLVRCFEGEAKKIIYPEINP